MDDAPGERNALRAVLVLETGDLGADVGERVFWAAMGLGEAVHGDVASGEGECGGGGGEKRVEAARCGRRGEYL